MYLDEKHGGAGERAGARYEPKSHTNTYEHSDHPAFTPKIELRDVFYEMITKELRDGRLTRARRKRIIQYAAHLGLSPVEAGRLITQCREAVWAHEDKNHRGCSLRLADPEPERMPTGLKIAIVAALAVAVDLVVLALWR